MASDGFPYPVDLPGNFSVNNGPTTEQLKPFGYAPGNYEMKCPVCRAPTYNVDKRAMRCWQCAVNAFRAAEAKGHASDCAVHNVPAVPAGPCDCDANVSREGVANLIRKHVRLEWHGHDHADINHRSVTEAADAIIKALRPRHDEDELAGILHKAFSHPDAVDHSNEVVGLPMLIRTKGGWYVLGEDGMRFNLVCASRDPKVEVRRA